ncbi:uncharacterized protein HD556DRAFT_1451309 [Suillus plorans]|uniref:F-box domain-containing protein n=1 Tax=Suillus plorans TaxID=116603 RepID=A0A9P7AAZ0_9AGAM|nr:uncharacterized protein HD556DRAFT_1451309 [Suillus plorans]KAG1784857.1 hypothetical protein HD556DRAFT_1451309 [Suillus plorans]
MTNSNCDIDRLPDDALRMIFESVCEKDQANFHDYSMQNEVQKGRYWDDWHQNECWYNDSEKESNGPPPLALIAAMCVCKRWRCLMSQIPTLWTVLQISFGDCAASLEKVRTFLKLSGTHPLKITLLWNDPHNPFNGAPRRASLLNPYLPEPVDESVAGAYLVLIILELYAHVHRWREFTMRTTSKMHIRQALVLMSRPSVHPAHMLEKLHVQLVHDQLNVDPDHHEPFIFPGSAPPINDLILFGTSWSWLSPSMFSSHLVNLRIHYCTSGGNINTATTLDVLLQLLGTLVNLQTLALELDMDPLEDIMSPIALPRLHYLAMKSRKMDCWIADFLHSVHMPNLRILTLDGVLDEFMLVEIQFEGILQELIRLTDTNSSSSLLELDELHLVNFAHRADPQLLHRLYKQMTSVKVLTLGPGAFYGNDAFAMGLLPTSRGLADFPFPGLRTLIVFDIPRSFVRRIVLERLSLVGPLEELYYQEPDSRPVPEEEEDIIVPDDWQHQVEKYHCIDNLESDRYCDVVSRRWSYLA